MHGAKVRAARAAGTRVAPGPRRSVRSRAGAAVACALAVAGAGCSSGSPVSGTSAPAGSPASAGSGPAVSISSSIKSGTALTQPVAWRASVTTASNVTIDHVDFLIDGRLLWSETQQPYEFNEDGMLTPWPVGIGQHTFTVRAVTSAGTSTQAAATVTIKSVRSATVLPTGSYLRTVTQADRRRVAAYRDAAHGAFGDPSSLGQWSMRVRADGVIVLDVVPGTQYDGFYLPYRSHGDRMTLYAPAVWLQPHPDQASRFCEPDPPATYRLTRHGQALTFTPIGHTCADRDAVLAGTWQRR
jgi:hypothetical protein